MNSTTTINWKAALVEQLEWHWQGQLRPRFAGLTDEEYFWEPVPGAWNIRPRGTSSAPIQAGVGAFTIEFAIPAPDPPPVTTISWRLAHLIVGVFGARVGNHFGGPPIDYPSFDYAGSAEAALGQLDEVLDAWISGVRGLDDAAMARPIGPAEGPWADHSMAELVFHINREAIHHGAEIALLRDLYAARHGTGGGIG